MFRWSGVRALPASGRFRVNHTVPPSTLRSKVPSARLSGSLTRSPGQRLPKILMPMMPPSFSASQRFSPLETVAASYQGFMWKMSSLITRNTWPVTYWASSLASQATIGELPAGSIGWYSSSPSESGSKASPMPPTVADNRVSPPGPTALAVTPMLASSRPSVWVIPTMAALAVA